MADVYGIELMDVGELDPGFVAVEALVVLKGFGPDGDIGLLVIHSEGLNPWEIMGIGDVIKSDAKSEMVGVYPSEEDDE